MAMQFPESFPDRFKRLIRTAFRIKQHEFVPAWVTVYECYSVEELNALVEAQILALQMRFRFTASCHADWVCPRVWYKLAAAIGNDDASEHDRPLSSWALKDPVGMVPSIEDLKQEMDWRKTISKALLRSEVAEKTLESLHSRYVREVCKDILVYERLLQEWYRLGSCQDQSDWKFNSREERKQFREKLKLQRLNVLDAKKKLEFNLKNGAPEFLIMQAAGQSYREKKILDQMHEVLVLCN